MGKSQLWKVELTLRHDKPANKAGVSYPTPVVIVTRPEPDEKPNHNLGIFHIRSITPRAAARRFIKGNLVTVLHLMDDGMNQPADLHGQTYANHGKPREEMKHAKKRARKFGEPVIEIRV